MKRLTIFVFLLVFIWGCALETKTYGTVILPDQQLITVEVADQFNEKRQGLAGRDRLAEDHGMLFVFKPGDYPDIWMKGMKFSIDIVFINNQEIVDIVDLAPVPLDNHYPTYRPRNQANYVLELPAGYAKKHQLKIGETLNINF